jgi:hypothetical protein
MQMLHLLLFYYQNPNVMPVLIRDVRKKTAIKPEKVYPEMFGAIENRNWEKFEKALKLLSSLIKEIDKILKIRLYVTLNTADKQQNEKMAERNLYRLIFCSAKVLLNEVLTNEKIDKKEYTKQAFRELQTLRFAGSEFAKANFSDEFSEALDNLDNDLIFEETIKGILSQIDILKKN